MTHITVHNLRGIARAEIEVDNIALIGGNNGEGKSSIIQGAAAALSASPLLYMKPSPTPGKFTGLLAKGQAGRLVKDGADKGSAIVSTPKGAATAAWPQGECETHGEALNASVYATGLADICALDAKVRASVLSGLLGATPERQDLADWLAENEYKWDASKADNPVSRAWDQITEFGWNETAKSVRALGQKLKGQWEGITAANYGSKIAEEWVPDAWEEGMETASADAMAAAVAEAKAAVEENVSSVAVSLDRIEQLEQAVAAARKAHEETAFDEPGLRDFVDTAKAAYDSNYDEVDKANKALAAIKTKGTPEETIVVCAHCGEDNALHSADLDEPTKDWNFNLRKPAKKPTKAALAKAAKALDAAEEAVTSARALAEKTLKAQGDAETALTVALNARQTTQAHLERAKKALADAQAVPEAAAVSEGDIDAAREALRRAEVRHDAFMAWSGARDKAASIARNAIFVAALDPGGVRARKLRGALDPFHGDFLGPICAAAGWEPVTLDNDMEPHYGGRHYLTMSDSEQFRTRTAIQIAVALLDGSAMVLIDKAEVLDKQGLSGLFQLLSSLGARLQSVVAMKVEWPKQLYDLEEIGCGRTYWVEDGVCAPLNMQEPAAAE